VISLALMWLQAAGLVGQALTLGGAAFALVVLRAARGAASPDRDRALALGAGGALLAAAAELGALASVAAAFGDEAGWRVAALLATTTGAVGLARVAIALGASVAAWTLRRAPATGGAEALLAAAALLLPVTGALVSHATSRPGGAAWLVAVGALHQAAVGAWVGGLACAVAAGARGAADHGPWLLAFSRLAMGAVAVVGATGIALAITYVPTPGAAIGTSYGMMVLTKIVLFGALLVMGGLNHRAVRAALASPASALRLRRRLEVEAGLAMVTILLAASIASAPPAADAGTRQVPAAEVRAMLVPQWPRLRAPSLTELAAGAALDDPLSPRADEDIAWSEFGHNVSGLLIVAVGGLAILAQSGHARWARHWPLLFVALTPFVAYNMDPEGWQTGLVGFWAHLLDPEVLQHKILLVFTALFGFGEWRAQQRPGSVWAYVLPVVAIASGIVLISHTHLVGDVRTAFFMEISHLAMGVLSLVVGWARWLELRLPAAEGRTAGRLWGPALLLFGLLLVFYRET
jgi:putative copper resistance protein D